MLQYYLAGWHIKPKGVKKPYVLALHTCVCPDPKALNASPLTSSPALFLFNCAHRYNPVLGEFFRCRYDYPDGSRGFYIAEQGKLCLSVLRVYICHPLPMLSSPCSSTLRLRAYYRPRIRLSDVNTFAFDV